MFTNVTYVFVDLPAVILCFVYKCIYYKVILLYQPDKIAILCCF
jgi:hypothetical protein